MNDLPLQIQKSVRRYQPIQTDGLTLYPILVREYDEWLVARQAIEVMQQSFPVAMLSKPLLQVYYELDLLPAISGEDRQPSGLWGCAMLSLSLSLRLGQGMQTEKRMLQFAPVVDRKNPKRLLAVQTMLNGEEIVNITPVQFQRLRPIIAAQNGVALESDDANPDLVQAERDLAEANNVRLNVTLEDKITFVAAKTNRDDEELYDWPIRKLNAYADVLTREDMFLANTIGGALGGFGKGGNPTPHPYYERAETGGVHMALSDFAGGAGVRAVANAGKRVE